ncbi:hypothetical protein KQI68_01690 [Peptoniphilus sp. MSJ-1]|uniref:Uncharacterized protein n=1 Tax=Peptoniphilus ovalis TaxID=2841503 RepID=A0ABS6FEE4_9FIRM|nr:hypothetical protein [Peptoniphilus ovalis]MBU5668545.1 hypothetical protein [Peptoniphilus ovalis]
MEYVDEKNSKFEMVIHVNGKKYMNILIPSEITLDILNLIHYYSYPDTETPTEQYVDMLNKVIDKKVNLQLISYLTKLDINYLEDLKNGDLKSENSKKLGDLVTILSLINDFCDSQD